MGQRFAMVEMKTAVAHVVRTCMLRPDRTHPFTPKLNGTIGSITGVHIFIEPRTSVRSSS